MSRKARTLLALAAVVAVGGAGYAVAQHAGIGSFASDATATSSAPAAGPSGVGASPVAAAPTTASPEITAPANPQSGQTLAKDRPVVVTGTRVPVVVNYSGWDAAAARVEVRGYVGGVVEEGGTCALTLTKDGVTATGQKPATPDASTTNCGRLTIPGDQLSPGTWQAVLSYRSADHTGSSDPVAIEVSP